MVKVQPGRIEKDKGQSRRRTRRRARQTASPRAAASQIDGAALAEKAPRALPARLRLAHEGGEATGSPATSTRASATGHGVERMAEAQRLEQQAAEGRKPKPFMAFLEPVNQATQAKSRPLPRLTGGLGLRPPLIADFEAVLVRSLAYTAHAPAPPPPQANGEHHTPMRRDGERG